MFTGLILESARVRDLIHMPQSKGARLELESCLEEAARLPMGASVAVNGVCLTLVEKSRSEDLLATMLAFEVSPETLERSNLGQLSSGSFVHIEFPLAAGAPLGGHVVSGHVDAMGEVLRSELVGDYQSVTISLSGEARKKIAPFLVEKGSIAIDGVSLTVNRVVDREDKVTEFEIMLIPHTLSLTWPDSLKPGRMVNLEADIMAKHVLRYKEFLEGQL